MTAHRPTADPRVVVVFHEARLGGAVLSVLRAIPVLEAKGWQFSFWVSRPSELFDYLQGEGHDVDGAPRYIDHSIRALRIPPGPVRRIISIPGYLRRFRAFLSEREITLVHANSVLALTEGVVAARAGHPTLIHVHEMVPSDRRGRVSRWAMWNRLHGVVVVSASCGETVAYRGQRPRIVYEAAPVPDAPVSIRPEPSPFVVGTVGIISARKGTDLFVDAAEIAMRRRPDLAFELVSGGRDERDPRWNDRILARAHAVGVEHIASTDVPQRMRSWDAFVLPSRADPFPISMLEAMAAGLPVIGADRDGIAEQVAPGCGVLVPSENSASLADAIVAMADASPSERAAMGSAARQRVIANFTVAHQAHGLDEAYRAAIAGDRDDERG